jgi:hypothetical protein
VILHTIRYQLCIGLFWLVCGLLFECGFFQDVLYAPWEKLLADYNVFPLCLLIVVWLTILFSPLICRKLTRG